MLIWGRGRGVCYADLGEGGGVVCTMGESGGSSSSRSDTPPSGRSWEHTHGSVSVFPTRFGLAEILVLSATTGAGTMTPPTNTRISTTVTYPR